MKIAIDTLSSLGGDCKEVSFSNTIRPKNLKAIQISKGKYDKCQVIGKKFQNLETVKTEIYLAFGMLKFY